MDVELINATATLIQALAVTATAVFGVRVLHTWRRERIGGRKIELAENILRQAEEVREAIFWATNGTSHPNELEELAKERFPSLGQGQVLKATQKLQLIWGVPALRIMKSEEKFTEFQRLGVLSGIYFQEKVKVEIKNIVKIAHEIRGHSITLYENHSPDTLDNNLISCAQSVIWVGLQEDNKTYVEIETSIKALREILQKVLL